MRRSRPMPSATVVDVGARRLADVRDLVDEGDARHERSVRGELHHLGRRDVTADDRRVDARVQRLDHVAVRRVEGADDDAVGLHEVADRRSLGGELRVRDVSDVLEAAIVEPVPNGAPRPDRHRALHRDDDPATDVGQLVHDGPDRGEVGVARVRRRSPHGDVDDVRAVDRLGDVRREAQPLARCGRGSRRVPARGWGRDPRGGHRSSPRRRP